MGSSRVEITKDRWAAGHPAEFTQSEKERREMDKSD